jgi:arsenic resistance protein ArsH
VDEDGHHPGPELRPQACEEFDDAGRMRPGPLYDRVVDVMEELVKFTLLTRDVSAQLTDRYSERKDRAEKQARVNLAEASGGLG